MSARIILILLIVLFLPQLHYLKATNDYKAMGNGRKFFVKNSRDFNDHTEIYLTNTDGHDIFIRLYEANNPKAIVHLVHGMAEHSYNYLDFINFLVDNGYTVVAHDHRGHGKSISEKYPNGYMRLSEELVDDTYAVNTFIRQTHPGLKLYMIGHSMGSMVARMYIEEYDDTIEKLVLSGTVEHSGVAGLGLFFANIVSFFSGGYQPSIMTPLLPGGDNDDTWISYNMDNVIAKRNDPMRIQTFLERGVAVIIDLNIKMAKVSKYKTHNPNLAILSATGEDDIVTGSSKGLDKTFETLKKAGYNSIENIVYPRMQHEILNEKENEIVYYDILDFLDR
ncbi:alpha/beta fold hydrolase [uncultured Anaerococcus sp.]|uniref:alpha/beta fold hydrolase n=1 Tax=uncultured Anaerococcus sp. TaxID=293428 RepID=UPI00261101D5|nr:alpha/beta hydrolase [uncultured Anaerococcus sp.]